MHPPPPPHVQALHQERKLVGVGSYGQHNFYISLLFDIWRYREREWERERGGEGGEMGGGGGELKHIILQGL